MKKYTLVDIFRARKSNDMKKVNETSLGRIYQHYSSEKSFAIITSWRAGYNKKKNLSLFDKLKSDVRSMGYGFNKLNGHWVECQDPDVSYNDCPKDQLVNSIEPALFIPGITFSEIKQLTKKYDQDASVYSGTETGGKVVLVFKDGSTQNIGKFHPNKISQAFSKVKGKSFTFEGFEYISQSWTEKLIEQNLENKIE